MKYNRDNPRPFDEGMGEAVAKRTVLRKYNLDGTPQTKADVETKRPFKWEEWGQVAKRVAEGNLAIVDRITYPGTSKSQKLRRQKTIDEVLHFQDHIANGSILMSGRHLQHGDLEQPDRIIELFSNCSTAATSFLLFYLLLNGSGVGRCYDDDMMTIDWSKQPYIHVCLDETHPDYDYTCMESLKQVKHKYADKNITVFTVPDSREGWAKALEHLESLIFEGGHENDIVVYDFSKVRCKNSLIGGMQLRPSSGPVPTMNMFNHIKSLKGCKMPLWRQSMYVDHYSAESVLVGGARRAARIATKYWRDPGILDFINVKRPWTIPEVKDEKGNVIRTKQKIVPLWSSNNSIGVDDEFWKEHKVEGTWANRVYMAACEASYYHGTGEPGFINLHKLECVREGMFTIKRNFGSGRYTMMHGFNLVNEMIHRASTKKWVMIVNPCGEIALSLFGGYCVIADVVPYHCDTLEECIDAVRLAARALIRTNLLDNIYHVETKRTNRIGVGLTGIHEFAWKFFKYNFNDLVSDKSEDFWEFLSKMSQAVRDETIKYATELKVKIPHTCLTIKPAGTTSKLFGLTEGAHLPAMKEYIRWVQFRNDDPLVQKYAELGYKTIKLKQYEGTTIVGFPTQPEICRIGVDKLVTASEASLHDQYVWLRKLEDHWLCSGRINASWGNQVSYTMKYDPKVVTFDAYCKLISDNQPHVRCCSVLPTVSDLDDAEYEYLPEQPVNLETYNEYVKNIKEQVEEDVDKVHVDCAGGACPVDFNKEK